MSVSAWISASPLHFTHAPDHQRIDLSAGSRMLLCTSILKCHSVVRWIRVVLSSVPVSTRVVYKHVGPGLLYWTVIRVKAWWHKKQRSLMVGRQRSIDFCGCHAPGLLGWRVRGLVASVSPALRISTSTWARAHGCLADSVACERWGAGQIYFDTFMNKCSCELEWRWWSSEIKIYVKIRICLSVNVKKYWLFSLKIRFSITIFFGKTIKDNWVINFKYFFVPHEK